MYHFDLIEFYQNHQQVLFVNPNFEDWPSELVDTDSIQNKY